MNQDSSRSHSIFTITIETTERLAPGAAASGDGHIRVRGGQQVAACSTALLLEQVAWRFWGSCRLLFHAHYTLAYRFHILTYTLQVGKLNLVDLAGSERQAKTGATGERRSSASAEHTLGCTNLLRVR